MIPSISDYKVSIITPVHNSAKYIDQTIRSVINQSHGNWEMLITDDYSTDDSVKLIESYLMTEPRIKLNQLRRNKGAGVARNVSIKHASGEVIAFLDADDLWDSDFLLRSLTCMEENKAAIVYSSYRRCSDDLSTHLGDFVVPAETDYKAMLKTCVISCLTGMYHVERCQGKAYMPEMRKRQDYCMWLTLLKRVDKAVGINDVLATYRIRPNSVSRNKLSAAKHQWQVYRSIEKLSLFSSIYYFMFYAKNGLAKNINLINLGLKRYLTSVIGGSLI